MAQKGLWNFARENVMKDRGALPEGERDVIREFQAMHEENFLSSWLREDGKNKEERIMEVDKETEEETGRKRMRRGETRERDGDCFMKVCQFCLD